MSRSFDDSQREYLQWTGAGPPVADYPFTLACWGKTDFSGGDQCLVWLGAMNSNVNILGYIGFTVAVGGNNPVEATSMYGVTTGRASANDYSLNTWHHVCGVFSAADSRKVILDGSTSGTDATSVPADNVGGVAIGATSGLSHAAYTSGAVAEAAVWDAALSDAEVAALAAGYSPLLIRPQNLVAYWPLGGLFGPRDHDLIGGRDLIAYNTPSWTDHRPLIYPGRPRAVAPASPVGSRIPWHLFQGRAA